MYMKQNNVTYSLQDIFQSSDEETKAIRERIVSIRRKIHKNTVTAVTARWNFEEGVSIFNLQKAHISNSTGTLHKLYYLIEIFLKFRHSAAVSVIILL